MAIKLRRERGKDRQRKGERNKEQDKEKKREKEIKEKKINCFFILSSEEIYLK